VTVTGDERTRARTATWFQRGCLTVDWAERPAFSPEEIAAEMLSEDEYREVLEREQEAADATERRRSGRGE
jgi:hypothetical protein